MQLNPLKYFGRLARRLNWPVLNQISHFAKFVIDNNYRSFKLTEAKYGEAYFQRSVFTLPNRYPLLFATCGQYLAGVANPKILSFGCSTGDEAFSISQHLPNALITGVDINSWCLKQCKKKYPGERFTFFHRFSAEFEGLQSLDAIFCMAVFQRAENRTHPQPQVQGHTFKQFEQEILMLDKKLKTGGLFIIDDTDFSFADTDCAKWYIPLNFENNKLVRARPLFNRDDLRVAENQNNYRMFVKQAV